MVMGQNRPMAWGFFSKYPAAILSRAIEVLQGFVVALRRLRAIAEEQEGEFASEGFLTLFAMLRRELTDEYFAEIEAHLRALRFRGGVVVSAELGKGNKGHRYVLRQAHAERRSWVARVLARGPGYTFYIHERDESGAKALGELRDRGLNPVAHALAASTDHILAFFTMLRTELAFYVGCLNLHRRLAEMGEPMCVPQPAPLGERRHACRELYDVGLALTMKRKIVGNELDADGPDLVMITGANQGGKSTFLQSIGVAQLMMQCGMFVPAESFSANVCARLFTHYKREEDVTMTSGKFDEELSRMSHIVDRLTPGSLVLFNESFAATNEREGAEVARQIVGALRESRIKVFFVTHMYELAHHFYDRRRDGAVFLQATRQADGARTFKLSVGEPLRTSYGEDLYKGIFGAEGVAAGSPTKAPRPA
jgi:DNA mismatch repair ATPase MutS